jgi:hypothetical protein
VAGARLDPELADEGRARGPKRLERLGLAARAVERRHLQATRPLPQRVFGHQSLELTDDVRVAPQSEIRFDATLECQQAQLLEATRDRIEERLVGEVGERRPTPQRQRRTKGGRRLIGVAAFERPAPVARELLEPLEIESAYLDTKDVPRALRLDRLLPEHLAETRHVALHEVPGRARWVVPPQPVDEVRCRDERVRATDEKGEHRSLLRRPESRLTAVHDHLERAEHAVLDGHRATLLAGGRPVDVAVGHALGYGGGMSRVPESSSIPLPGLALRLLLLPR